MLEAGELCPHHCRMGQMLGVGMKEVNSFLRKEARLALGMVEPAGV
jgi:hypothetical protein